MASESAVIIVDMELLLKQEHVLVLLHIMEEEIVLGQQLKPFLAFRTLRARVTNLNIHQNSLNDLNYSLFQI